VNATNIQYPPNTRKGPGPSTNPRFPGVVFRFEPYTNPWYLRTLVLALAKVQERTIADRSVLNSCNSTFSRLGGNKTFSAIWNDPEILISFWPAATGSSWNLPPSSKIGAVTIGKNISVAEWFLKKNDVLALAGALVHELAHVAGAGHHNSDAEDSLNDCGFEDQSQEGLIGEFIPYDARTFVPLVTV
jgi:hypothetical protein